MEQVFTTIYETSVWGRKSVSAEYKVNSGTGSAVEYNKKYIQFLKKFITDRNIKTVVDLGCGDFRCGSLIYNELVISYTGYDVYKKIVEAHQKNFPLPKYNFIHLDFCNQKEKIISGELCILKDVLQHWSLENITTFLDYLVSIKKFKYILLINCYSQTQDNTDIVNGKFRPLSCNFLPLKKYNPKKLYNYKTKEVSVIEL